MIYIQLPSKGEWAAGVHIKAKLKVRHSVMEQRPSGGRRLYGTPEMADNCGQVPTAAPPGEKNQQSQTAAFSSRRKLYIVVKARSLPRPKPNQELIT